MFIIFPKEKKLTKLDWDLNLKNFYDIFQNVELDTVKKIYIAIYIDMYILLLDLHKILKVIRKKYIQKLKRKQPFWGEKTWYSLIKTPKINFREDFS